MRELSAQLTEGEIFNSQIYVFAYTAKIAINIQITDSDHSQFHVLSLRPFGAPPSSEGGTGSGAILLNKFKFI